MSIILYLVRLKMELDKKCLLFCFYQNKMLLMHIEIICKTYDENVIAIRTCVNWF